MEGPCHSVLLKGNIKGSGQLSILIPNAILQHGLWQICIKTISFQSLEIVNNSITIDANYVNDLKYSITNEIESYNAILSLFLLKANVNEIKVFQLFETWFVCNSIKPLLELTFRNSLNNEILINLNVNFQILVLFKRIR